MLKYFCRKSRKGFTVVELLLVLAIFTILLGLGTLHWRRAKERREFQSKFDLMVKQIQEAQANAQSYGLTPSGYSRDETFVSGQLRNYVVLMVNNGIGKANRINNYENIQLAFNFQVPPMSEKHFKEDYKGVGLGFGYKDLEDPTRLRFDCVLLFDATKAPWPPTKSDGSLYSGVVVPVGQNYVIQMSLVDKSNGNIRSAKQIWIHKTTGAIKTYNIK